MLWVGKYPNRPEWNCTRVWKKDIIKDLLSRHQPKVSIHEWTTNDPSADHAPNPKELDQPHRKSQANRLHGIGSCFVSCLHFCAWHNILCSHRIYRRRKGRRQRRKKERQGGKRRVRRKQPPWLVADIFASWCCIFVAGSLFSALPNPSSSDKKKSIQHDTSKRLIFSFQHFWKYFNEIAFKWFILY